MTRVMKVLVLGATGSVGRLVVEEALRRGHAVIALVRHPERLGAVANRVNVVEGDALERSDGWTVASSEAAFPPVG